MIPVSFWGLGRPPSMLNEDLSKRLTWDFLTGIRRSKWIHRLVPFFLLASAPIALLCVGSWNITRELAEIQRDAVRNCDKSLWKSEQQHGTTPVMDFGKESQTLGQPNGPGHFLVRVKNLPWVSISTQVMTVAPKRKSQPVGGAYCVYFGLWICFPCMHTFQFKRSWVTNHENMEIDNSFLK